jgi:hypothetical protein
MAKQIKHHYIILNDGLNLATPDKEFALRRLRELLTLMEEGKHEDWRIELSFGS